MYLYHHLTCITLVVFPIYVAFEWVLAATKIDARLLLSIYDLMRWLIGDRVTLTSI